MYTENIDILVDGKIITINVPCEPDTPMETLKKRAIDIYLWRLKNRLMVQNSL